jgi:type IV pilus secretin PilQ/predicted competence protein
MPPAYISRGTPDPTVELRPPEPPTQSSPATPARPGAEEDSESVKLVAAAQRSGDSRATGNSPLITLHLDDVEVRKALEVLSRQGSLNILVSPNVSGRVTANLQGLTVEETLAAILRLCNLAARREHNVIYVHTPQEIIQSNLEEETLSLRVYRLNYIKSADLESMITKLLSDKGKLSVTPESEVGIGTNTDQAGGDSLAGGDTVIVQDYESVLKTLDKVVADLDVRPIQVLIEAVILEVTCLDSTDLGVNFAVLDGAGRVLNVLGNGAEINASVGFDPSQVLTAGAGSASATLVAAGGKVVGTSRQGFAADTHGIKFGFVDKDVTGFIRALEAVGDTRVLASPRVLVLNKQRAELVLGERIGYKTLTVTETAAVEKIAFLNVGTQLRLRPFVASDGMIRMEIHPERSSGEVNEITGVPRTSTSELTTNVLVPDGSTIVLAGLMEEEDITQQSGVPGLSRLPWVGTLFRQKNQSSTKKELVVLLTPHIWNPAGSVASAPADAAGAGEAPIERAVSDPQPEIQTTSNQVLVPEKSEELPRPVRPTARGKKKVLFKLPSWLRFWARDRGSLNHS